jgi:hypothetical protein
MSARAPRRAAHRAGKEEEGRSAQTRAQCAHSARRRGASRSVRPRPWAARFHLRLSRGRPRGGSSRRACSTLERVWPENIACAPQCQCIRPEAQMRARVGQKTQHAHLNDRGTNAFHERGLRACLKKRNKKCHPALELAGRRTNLKVCSAVLTRRCSKRWGAQRYSGSVGSLAHARRQSIWAHAAGSADGQSRQGRARRRRRSWQALRCASVAADGAHSPWLCELLRRPPAQCCSVCAC